MRKWWLLLVFSNFRIFFSFFCSCLCNPVINITHSTNIPKCQKVCIERKTIENLLFVSVYSHNYVLEMYIIYMLRDMKRRKKKTFIFRSMFPWELCWGSVYLKIDIISSRSRWFSDFSQILTIFFLFWRNVRTKKEVKLYWNLTFWQWHFFLPWILINEFTIIGNSRYNDNVSTVNGKVNSIGECFLNNKMLRCHIIQFPLT